MSPRLLAPVAAALVAVGLCVWLASPSGSGLAPAAPPAPDDELDPAPTSVAAIAAPQPVERVAAGTAPAGPLSPHDELADRVAGELGSVGVRLVDSEGRPVAGLRYLAYSERRGNEVVAAGRSDADGYVDIDRLPEDTWILCTERRPPFASTTRARWLPQGGLRDVSVTLDPGATVEGRVVDDLGQPVEGISILGLPIVARQQLSYGGSVESAFRGLQDDPLKLQAFATTDAQGRFRVPHLAGLPSAIWIDDEGQMRPARLTPVQLRLGTPSGAGLAASSPYSVQVMGQQITRVGDWTVLRSVTLGGRILRSGGEPVVGARLHLSRLTLYGWVDADLNEDLEAWSGADGRYALRFPGEFTRTNALLLATGPHGSFSSRSLPTLLPGERVPDFDIELPGGVPIELTVRSGGPEPWPTEALSSLDDEASMQAAGALAPTALIVGAEGRPIQEASGQARIEFHVEGQFASLELTPDGRGLGFVELAQVPERPRARLFTTVHGWTEFDLVPAADGRLVGNVTLRPLPTRTLRFVPAAPIPRGPLDLTVVLRAGLEGPNQLEQGGSVSLSVGKDDQPVTSIGKEQVMQLHPWSESLPYALELRGDTDAIACVRVHPGLGHERGERPPLAEFESLPPGTVHEVPVVAEPAPVRGETEDGVLPVTTEVSEPRARAATVVARVYSSETGREVEGASLRVLPS
ncbi:MAG: hypothetical protein AAFZ65_15265, partial [Planctomycetota bacterium]